jgi:hypothetical protein
MHKDRRSSSSNVDIKTIKYKPLPAINPDYLAVNRPTAVMTSNYYFIQTGKMI